MFLPLENLVERRGLTHSPRSVSGSIDFSNYSRDNMTDVGLPLDVTRNATASEQETERWVWWAESVNVVQNGSEEIVSSRGLTLGTPPTRMLLMSEHSRTWPSCRRETREDEKEIGRGRQRGVRGGTFLETKMDGSQTVFLFVWQSFLINSGNTTRCGLL